MAISLSAGEPPHRADRILIKPKPDADAGRVNQLHGARRGKVLKTFERLGGVQVVSVPAGETASALVERYRRSGLIEFAEPDYIVQAAAFPDDPHFTDGTQWGLHNTGQAGGLPDADIDAPEAWTISSSAANVVVAVIDSGVRHTHEDLAGNMWINPLDGSHGFNAFTGAHDPVDDYGHGTHLAGILGAAGNNGRGISGVAWRAQIMACKFLNSAGNGAISDALRCIEFARANGASIMVLSWGGSGFSISLSNALHEARGDGIIFVAAAGNNARDVDAVPYYPASFNLDNVVSVGASTRTDDLFHLSNFGAANVDLFAPGASIYSTWHVSDNAYFTMNGTSMSAPLVAGTLALLREQSPGADYTQLIARVLATTDEAPEFAGRCVTGGRLNLARALELPPAASFTVSPEAGVIPLSVQFTDESTGPIIERIWDFGDGTRVTNVMNPAHTFLSAGTFTATLSVAGTGGETDSATTTIVAQPTYAIEERDYEWVVVPNDTNLSLGDNGVSAAQQLPFAVSLFGSNYSSLHVSANGLAGFLQGGLDLPLNTPLPDAPAPNATICPYWDDLYAGPGSRVSIGTMGNPPDRKTVITWKNMLHTGAGIGATRFTFQVVLSEATPEIRFNYKKVENGDTRFTAGRSATIGIENDTGAAAIEYSFNGARLVANHQSIVFAPVTSVAPPPSSPAKLDLISLAASQPSQLQLTGEPGRTYIIYASTNMTQWTPVFTNATAADGTMFFNDPEAAACAQRYYRAMSGP